MQEHKNSDDKHKMAEMAVCTAMRNRLRLRQMLKIKGIRDKISIPNTLQRFLSTYTTKPFGYQSEKYSISSFF